MRVVGVTFAGVLKNGTASPAAFVFGTDARTLELFEDDTDYKAINALQQNIGSVDTTISPYSIDEQYSNYRFHLVASDLVGEHVLQKARRAVDNLQESMSETTTDLFLQQIDLDQAPFDATDDDGNNYNVVYIAQETILIPEGSHAGSGLYTNVVRGAGDSVAGRYEAGLNVYDQVPFWPGRKVVLFDWTPHNGLTVREPQKVRGSLTQKNGLIAVQTDSYLSRMGEGEVNRRPIRFGLTEGPDTDAIVTAVPYYERYTSGIGEFFLSEDVPIEVPDKETRLLKKRDKSGVSIDPEWLVMHTGDWVNVLAHAEGDDYVIDMGESRIVRNRLKQPTMGSDDAQDVREQSVAEAFYFPFVIFPSAGFGTLPTRAFQDLPSTVDTLEGTVDVDDDLREVYAFHPIAIAAGFLLSTPRTQEDPEAFDLYDANWSLNVRDAFSDDIEERLHQIITDTPDLQVDFVYLGHERRSERIVDWIRDVMNTYGFRFGVDNEGKLIITDNRLPDIDAYNTVLDATISAVPSKDISQKAYVESSTRIRANIPRLPWQEETYLEVSSTPVREAEARGVLENAAQREQDFTAPTVLHPVSLQGILTSRVLIQDFNTHEIVIRAEDHVDDGKDYTLGNYALVTDIPLAQPWYWDTQGNRLGDVSDTSLKGVLGRIIGRKYIPTKNVYELRLLIDSDVPNRWRAPSGVICEVTSFSAASSATLALQTLFHDQTEDAAQFNVGDQLIVYDESGFVWREDDIAEITSISGDAISVDHPWPNPPPSGYVIELAHLNTTGDDAEPGYYNPGARSLTNIDRLYVFYADDDSTLGDEGFTADQYSG